jgi:hypothetical protein
MPADEESDHWANAHRKSLTLFEPELNDKPRRPAAARSAQLLEGDKLADRTSAPPQKA